MRYDVTIIGGGVVGCAIARELSRYRLNTVLLEKESDVGFGTSKSNSGIIHAGHHSNPDTLKGKLEWEGNPLWDDLHRELGFGFKRIGELTVAFNEQEQAVLEKLHWQGEIKGVPGLVLWDRARIRREEPSLSRSIISALYAPTAGVINPYEACFGLAKCARLNALDMHLESPVQSIRAVDDGWEIQTPRETITTRYVINAAGLYADQIAGMAGAKTFSMKLRKGEEYILDKRLDGLVDHIIFPCPTPVSKGILVIPTFDGTIMVGPTAHEVDDPEDLTTSAAGAEEVFLHVRRLVPGISERDCIAEFAGTRAVSTNGDFVIEPSSQKGFINVAGIQSPGLTAAPAIAIRVVNILRDEGLSLSLKDDFMASIPKAVHMAGLPLDEQIRLSTEDHRYGHIICRCEQISEREILDAVEDGARTLDGLKFRTRAGMGRCQGAFCTPRCMQLLAQALDLPLERITKRGNGSWLVCQREQETQHVNG
ncbi:MAG: NAD(P)/FAD-dependent oxidoreductase [Anaerolineae bacterium]